MMNVDAKEVERRLVNTKTYAELINWATSLCDWQRVQSSKRKTIGRFFLCCVFFLTVIFVIMGYLLDRIVLLVPGLLLLSIGAMGYLAFVKEAKQASVRYMEKLSKQAILRSLELRYGFTLEDDLPEQLKSSPEVTTRWKNPQKAIVVAKGVYQGHLHALDYYFYQMYYTGTQQENTLKKRSFLFVRFPWVNGISLRSDESRTNDYKFKGRVSEEKFNRQFVLTGMSEMACARFAKPMTVLHMLKFPKILWVPNFLFSKDGWLCIGFNNVDPSLPEIWTGVKDANELLRILKKDIKIPFMTRLMQLVHELAEQHDDNFEDHGDSGGHAQET